MDAEGADAGTGSPGSEHLLADPSPGSIAEEEPDAVLEDSDLQEYARTLGVDADADADLMWVVEEAFNAALPAGWAEFTDDSGRVYYFHDAKQTTTWEHPMDEVFRELILLVKHTRIELAAATEAQRLAVVREHLQQAHRQALQQLSVWSGPYPSDAGEYYYNEELNASSWECPVTERQNELTVRHAVLTRCLLSESIAQEAAGMLEEATGAAGGGVGRNDLLESLRLPLGLVRQAHGGAHGTQPDTPSTSRTFYTARSATSSRSRHSNKSDRQKRHKEKKEHKHREHREHRTQEAAAPAPPPSAFQTVD